MEKFFRLNFASHVWREKRLKWSGNWTREKGEETRRHEKEEDRLNLNKVLRAGLTMY